MSDATASHTSTTHFDDRLDTDTRISNLEVVGILWRALKLVSRARGLFLGKIGLGFIARIPILYLPWLAKIVIDQVLLQEPFDQSEVPFPPHVAPFVDAIAGLSPMGIMAAVTGLLFVLLIFFGSGETWARFSEGEDSATQSENAISEGGSGRSGIIGILETLVHIRMSQRLTNHLRTELFRCMGRLPMTVLDNHRIGDAVYRVMYDAPMLPRMCYRATLEPLFALVGAAISLYMIGYSYGDVAPELVWAAFAVIPAGLCITVPFSGISRRVQQESRAAGSATTNALEESLGNVSAVQSLGGMAREKERIDARSSESFRRYRFVKLVELIVGFTSFGAVVVFGFWAYVFITDQVIDGVLTPGDWGVLFGLGLSLGLTALGVGTFWIELQGNAAAVRRVFFFLDQEIEKPGGGSFRLEAFAGSVRIEGIDFTYPDGRQALKGIDLDLASGQLVAIVGPTGAGKTSLAYLIPGFIRPDSGRVLVDGRDIEEVDVDSLRDQVSYVFQEHVLMSESIRDNLLMVQPDATEADMLEALTTAGALEFVRALPDGMDTVLGRSGDTLSVGQKQRLCIARGLIRDTPVLILDEPTAALDPQTEIALVQALRDASRGRLVIVIAHRLSTIRQADRIVFLEEGEIRDIGSHEALMGDPASRYRRFVELQGGG